MGQSPWEALVPSDSLVWSITVMEGDGKRGDCRAAIGQRGRLEHRVLRGVHSCA